MARTMRLMTLVLALAAIGGGANFAHADAASPEQIAAWIEQLGDNRYAAREAAQAALTDCGLAALDQLKAAAASPDAEVRFRVSQIMALLIESEFEQQLAAFVADVDGAAQVTLPAWDLAKPFLGEDRFARETFVQMARAEPDLMRALEKGGAQAENVLAMRIAVVQNETRQVIGGRRVEPKVGSYAALLLGGATTNLFRNEPASTGLCQLCLGAPFPAAMLDARQRPGLVKMLGAWIERAAGGGLNLQYQLIFLATTHGVEQGVLPARKILEAAGTPPSHRVIALLAVARFGGRDDLPLVEKSLGDASVYSKARRGDKEIIEIQVRDLALAAALHLTEQELKGYGFEQIHKHPQFVFSPNGVTFRDAAARDAAFAKWKTWREGVGQEKSVKPKAESGTNDEKK